MLRVQQTTYHGMTCFLCLQPRKDLMFSNSFGSVQEDRQARILKRERQAAKNLDRTRDPSSN